MKYLNLLIVILFLSASSIDDARKANQAFENGNYERAAELYKQAIEQDPENPKLHFNLASALQKMGRSQEAMESYERFESLSELPEEQSLASYNQGTMLTEEDNFKEAAEYFRDALRKNPNDPDARHNYELALKRQQQQQDQQEQQDQESGDNNDEQNEDQEQQEGNNDPDQNQDENQPPNSGQQPEQQDGNEEPQPQPQPSEMTPEEAENILDALEQLERELLENMKKESSETQSANDKDW